MHKTRSCRRGRNSRQASQDSETPAMSSESASTPNTASSNYNRTVSIHFVHAALRGARQRGEAVEPLLVPAGIPASALDEPRARVSFEQYARLLQSLWRHMDDELLGCGRHPLPLGSFGMICRAIIHSNSMGQAMSRASRYYALLQGGRADFMIARDGDLGYLIIEEAQNTLPDHFLAETLLVAGHRFASWLVGDSIPLKHVDFSFAMPVYKREYEIIFAAPLRFDAERTALCFPAAFLDAPVVQGDDSLRVFLRNSIYELLLRREHGKKVSAQVRRMLGHDEDGSTLHLETAAERLAMSPQTLRRHLKREGNTFQGIKDGWRRDTAITLLAETPIPIAEIARRVGFSESSTFHRAFKHWTGLQPSAYRTLKP
ncbi:AraC family transcriptional regulator [Lysobacter gummosus]|uniref:AraC family transcriptional regulator n=1 Tax=Lysobacter gummosus TaxID=262324 RepID=UPI0036261278